MNEKLAILTNILILICIGISGWSLVTQIDNSKGLVRQEEITKNINNRLDELKDDYKEVTKVRDRVLALEIREELSIK